MRASHTAGTAGLRFTDPIRRQIGARRKELESGFSLITVLPWIVLLGLVALLLHLRLLGHLESLPASERQLYSLVVAHNGIEYARSVLPLLELNSLLKGQDGRHAGTNVPEWRNPLPWSRARTTDPARIRLTPDDGLPWGPPEIELGAHHRLAGNGHFFIRFSNNPEEPPDEDRDGIVVVRSLGVAAGRLPNLSLGRVVHSTSLVEARLRQERVFQSPSAVTLLGESGRFQWEGEDFEIRGGVRAAISLVAPGVGPQLEGDLAGSLSEAQRSRIGGRQIRAWADETAVFSVHPHWKRLFSTRFWEHFEQHLPEFSEPAIPGLRFLPAGGELQGRFHGVLVAQGSLRLTGTARVRGLVVHLGGGIVALEDEAQLTGALWMRASNGSATGAVSGRIRLRIAGNARIIFDSRAMSEALWLLPPTQLGWRILFPEMAL